MDDNETDKLHKKALFLSWFTVIYNILEGLASVIAAMMSGSVALIGFGFDSLIESLSGCVMIWRFSKKPEYAEKFEEKAEKLVGISLLIIAVYVSYESVMKFITQEKPEPSLFGMIIAFLSLIIMPVLYVKKRDTGKAIGSRALIADSKETLACSMLSAALLAGLALNYFWGLWWADPAAGLFIAGFLVKEGIEAVRGKDEDENGEDSD